MKMKKVVLGFMVLFITQVEAQLKAVIPITVPGVWVDVATLPLYPALINEAAQTTATTLEKGVHFEGVKQTITRELKEITEISASLRYNTMPIKNFIRLKSYNFIKTKYSINPLVIPSNSTIIRNTATRLRFKIKLNAEQKKVDSYLSSTNYMSEGERILMTLTSLENVIKTSLENDEF